jgi:hypothetical protein
MRKLARQSRGSRMKPAAEREPPEQSEKPAVSDTGRGRRHGIAIVIAPARARNLPTRKRR